MKKQEIDKKPSAVKGIAIRPKCFEFAMEFIGDPEAGELRAYIGRIEEDRSKYKEALERIADRDIRPEYHSQGMGCGLEDRGITDRYEAMSYGWNEAMDRVYDDVISIADATLGI